MEGRERVIKCPASPEHNLRVQGPMDEPLQCSKRGEQCSYPNCPLRLNNVEKEP